MDDWATLEFAELDMPDQRLKKRAVQLLEDLVKHPESTIPTACGDWAGAKAAYRFFDNDRVSADAIRQAHAQQTAQRVQDQAWVLLLQDTTGMDFTAHRATQGLGMMDNKWVRGLKVHSVLAASTEGVPQGVVYQEVWARDDRQRGKRHRRRALPIQQKESMRWVRSLERSRAVVPASVTTVTVADREADIYEVFAAPRSGPAGSSHLLIRAAQDRRVSTSQQYLWDSVRAARSCGTMTAEIGRSGNRVARQAKLRLRHRRVELLAPRHRTGAATGEPVVVTAVLAEEIKAPKGEKRVSWLLLTTLEVRWCEDAARCVRWYSYRWLVERYHFVLKSGCQVEQLQLETADRLERALAMYSMVAWRLLWLMYESRVRPEESCEVALGRTEWQALYATTHKTAGVPSEPPTLREAVRWIAQLGGLVARKGDGHPGVKTIWRGWMRLIDIAATCRLLRPDVGNG